MKSKKITLYKNHKNAIGTWSIWFENTTIFIEHASVIGGALVQHTEEVPEGKASRTLIEQIVSRIKSRVNKQLDKGYVRTIDEAAIAPTNALNLLQPMLAQPLKRVSRKLTKAFIQPKLDGHRCLITRHGDSILAYSRQGKMIDTIDHILSGIDIPEGVTLDGELYVHGEKLQTIASWAKRLQPNSQKLNYHVYDVVSDDPYGQRWRDIYSYDLGAHVKKVETEQVDDLSQVNLTTRLHWSINEGYEGLIIRDDMTGYEAGRRSGSLIKLKQVFDDEFRVVDITESSTGWGVLTCITKEERAFGVSAPGTHDEKRDALVNKDKYIGRYVTVEYSQLTADKIPFHPVALRWRNDL